MYKSLTRIALFMGVWFLVGIQQNQYGELLIEGHLGLRIVFWAMIAAVFAECVNMARKTNA